MTAGTHCSAELDRTTSRVSQASPRRTSLASKELSPRRNLTVMVLTEATIIVVEASMNSHKGKVGSSTQTSKLAIRKLFLSCDKCGVLVFKCTCGNGLVPSIVCARSAGLDAVHHSAVAANRSGVL